MVVPVDQTRSNDDSDSSRPEPARDDPQLLAERLAARSLSTAGAYMAAQSSLCPALADAFFALAEAKYCDRRLVGGSLAMARARAMDADSDGAEAPWPCPPVRLAVRQRRQQQDDSDNDGVQVRKREAGLRKVKRNELWLTGRGSIWLKALGEKNMARVAICVCVATYSFSKSSATERKIDRIPPPSKSMQAEIILLEDEDEEQADSGSTRPLGASFTPALDKARRLFRKGDRPPPPFAFLSLSRPGLASTEMPVLS